LLLSVGVKVTEYPVTPLSDTDGFVDADVHENTPAKLADPPVNTEFESVSPYVMTEAVGAVLIVVGALLTISITDVDAVL
jgi:hypothetical protein